MKQNINHCAFLFVKTFKIIKATSIFFLSIFFSISSIAQNSITEINNLPQENIFVHYNTNLILTGEKLYYKVYNLTTNNKLSSLSKIAYIEIIDSNNNSLFKQKLNLTNGVASSDIFIPTSVTTGSYKLIAYTHLMMNVNHFFEDTVYIINPFEKPEKNDLLKENTNTQKTNLNTLKATKKYSKREKVTIDLGKENLTGNISLSVRRINPENFPSRKAFKPEYKSNTLVNAISMKYLPELRGDLIYGTLKIKNNNKPAKGKKIGLSTIGKNPFTLFATTNKNGEFYFNLKNNNTSKLLFQVLEKNRKDYTISIVKDTVYKRKFTYFPEITFTKKLSELIKNRSTYLQIENSYKSVKQDKNLHHKIKDYVFSKKTTTYVLNDYKRFKTMKEVATEILSDVWYTEKKKQFSLHVRDNNLDTNSSIPSLVIIDGYIVYNHSEIVDIDALKIEKIAIVKEKYIYGGVLYQGIMNIKTFKNNYKPNSAFVKEVSVLKPESLKEYFYQDHSNKNKTKRIPDYRTQLLWKPNLLVTDKKISFYTSDVIGDYKIEILGISSEGKPIIKHHYFSVK